MILSFDNKVFFENLMNFKLKDDERIDKSN